MTLLRFPRRFRTIHNLKRKAPLTVCIAAVCDDGRIVLGASDRMLTSGDIEFEPSVPAGMPSSKILPLGGSLSIMTAGHAGLHAEIYEMLYPIVQSEAAKHKDRGLPITEALRLYVECYNRAKLQRAASAVLAPFGLNHAAFLTKQEGMSESFLAGITQAMLDFQMPCIEAIISGVDGPPLQMAHIYVLSNGDGSTIDFRCDDSIGFAAIGIGARHAESQFMLAGHSRFSTFPETLLRLYSAKKKSEIAPGVGKETDIVLAGPDPGRLILLTVPNAPLDINRLHAIYDELEMGQKAVLSDATKKITEYVDSVFKRPAPMIEQPTCQTGSGLL